MATTVCITLVRLPLSEILIKLITLKWKQPKIVILLFESSILQFAMVNTILKSLLEASMWKLSPPIYCKLNSSLGAPSCGSGAYDKNSNIDPSSSIRRESHSFHKGFCKSV